MGRGPGAGGELSGGRGTKFPRIGGSSVWGSEGLLSGGRGANYPGMGVGGGGVRGGKGSNC